VGSIEAVSFAAGLGGVADIHDAGAVYLLFLRPGRFELGQNLGYQGALAAKAVADPSYLAE